MAEKKKEVQYKPNKGKVQNPSGRGGYSRGAYNLIKDRSREIDEAVEGKVRNVSPQQKLGEAIYEKKPPMKMPEKKKFLKKR